MKMLLRVLFTLVGLMLLAMPAALYLSGRNELVLAFVAVGLAGLCSLLAYRGSVAVRRRIDAIGAQRPRPRHSAERDR